MIDDRRDRLVTMLIAPLMSCSARLPVYVLLIGAFVPNTALLGGWLRLQALVLLIMYLAGVVVAIPVAWIARRLCEHGPPQPFLMELPPYHWPSVGTVLHRLWEQGKAFCLHAGTIIVAVTIVVWALGYYPAAGGVAGAVRGSACGSEGGY